MKVLDLDMDYFLDYPVDNIRYDSEQRVDDVRVINSVWSEERVRLFLENNLGLSKNNKIMGRIVKGHNEALFFWKELIERELLDYPFSVVHVDSHADLGIRDESLIFILDDLICWNVENRIRSCGSDCEKDGRFYNIEIGNYLLYALAYRWIEKLVYCGNPNNESGDVPPQILLKGLPSYDFDRIIKSKIKLQPLNEDSLFDEPEIPFKVIPKVEQVSFSGDFDFVLLAQSPNYTPKNADYIMDVFKEFIIPI